jgi:hypothetical protein
MRRSLLVIATCLAGGALACEPPLSGRGVSKVESGQHVIALKADPKIAVGVDFALDLGACARSGPAPTALRIQAEMPEHRHGMNYAPTLQATGPGRWKVEGMHFHMPGRWELRFVIGAGRNTDRVTYSVKVE